jgi:hypothetical protein
VVTGDDKRGRGRVADGGGLGRRASSDQAGEGYGDMRIPWVGWGGGGVMTAAYRRGGMARFVDKEGRMRNVCVCEGGGESEDGSEGGGEEADEPQRELVCVRGRGGLRAPEGSR